MSFDSLRAKNKEDRKVFQENGYLASFLDAESENNEDWLLPDYDPSALINVIRRLKPVVIVDESHNAAGVLSVEMLGNLNPGFILDLTATPRSNSNIISFVNAMQLKKYHMVKLPVIVSNRHDKDEVIDAAFRMRCILENIAIEEEKNSGKYIRPIILFQAQLKTDDDNTTFEKIKENLIARKIPAEQIMIKTADINELKDINLISRDCPVRYIITVNALKEGWDCPFAYILASLADKSSAIDVEQILGRVLRMPHVQQHNCDWLNMSYVFTASSRFADTLKSVVAALNNVGFSSHDYRAFSSEDSDGFSLTSEIMSSEEKRVVKAWSQYKIGLAEAATTLVGNTETSNLTRDDPSIDAVMIQAVIENQRYEKEAKTSSNHSIPAELESKMNKHRMKPIFREAALQLKLPQFVVKIENDGGWLDESHKLLNSSLLLSSFKLESQNSEISFEDIENETYKVDLEEIGTGEYAPKSFKVNQKDRRQFNKCILQQSTDTQIESVVARLLTLISPNNNLHPIHDGDAKNYLRRIIRAWNPDRVKDCLENDASYARKIRMKINDLTNEHAYIQFNANLKNDTITAKEWHSLSDLIYPRKNNEHAIPNSLYVSEGTLNLTLRQFYFERNEF